MWCENVENVLIYVNLHKSWYHPSSDSKSVLNCGVFMTKSGVQVIVLLHFDSSYTIM